MQKKNKFTDADYRLMKYLCELDQSALHNLLFQYLNKYYKEPVSTTQYIYAEGNIPVALVAHLDTVFEKPPSLVFYDSGNQVMWSPNGMGADDRAGVFAIIKIISHGFRPHIIFTHDEEMGGIGASELSKCPMPFDDLRYIIELDRQGMDDCVFYDCTNNDFEEYVEGFGFKTARGSFTDISFLCPKWEIAGVNLSVGYVNEHTPLEHLFCDFLMETVYKVENMLSEDAIPHFKYISSNYDYYQFKNHPCECCHKVISEIDGCIIKDERSTHFYCDDCLDKMNWCEKCGAPYLYDAENPDSNTLYCPNCYEWLASGGPYVY